MITCPFCLNQAPDLLESRGRWMFCSVCARRFTPEDAARAARNRPQPGMPSPYRTSTEPPDVSRQAKAARVMKALFVDVPLSDAEKADDPDFGL